MSERIKVGAFKGPHGLQGWVKAALAIEDPKLLIHAGPCQTEAGEMVVVLGTKTVGQGLVGLQIQGVTTPEAAALLRGALYLPRAALPVNEDEVLLADLVGQPLRDTAGQPCGAITAIADLPAGPALEVLLPEKIKTILIPINPDFVELAATPPTATLTAWGMALLTL